MTQAFNLSQLANGANTSGQLDAANYLYNQVPVANGGTALSSAGAAGNMLIASSASAYSAVPMPTFGFRNRIINGAMSIAQRGTSYALTTSLGYGSLDRFFSGQNTSANGRFVQLAYNANGFPNIALLGRNGSATTTGVIYAGQTIETTNVAGLAGGAVTLSFYAYAGANFSAASSQISVFVVSGTGVNQGAASMVAGTWTGTSNIVSTTQTINTTFTRYTFTGNVPSNCQELGFYIAYTPVGTAGADDNIYFTGVQLEAGSIATAFDVRPYGTELALCQRYYWKGGYGWTGNCDSTSTGLVAGSYPVTMRAIPTVGYVSGGGTSALTQTGGGVGNIVAVSNQGSGVGGGWLYFTAGSYLQYVGQTLIKDIITASAEL